MRDIFRLINYINITYIIGYKLIINYIQIVFIIITIYAKKMNISINLL